MTCGILGVGNDAKLKRRPRRQNRDDIICSACLIFLQYQGAVIPIMYRPVLSELFGTDQQNKCNM